MFVLNGERGGLSALKLLLFSHGIHVGMHMQIPFLVRSAPTADILVIRPGMFLFQINPDFLYIPGKGRGSRNK